MRDNKSKAIFVLILAVVVIAFDVGATWQQVGAGLLFIVAGLVVAQGTK